MMQSPKALGSIFCLGCGDMRILVTGANGFIAREIIVKLAMSGHDIIACVHHRIFKNIPHSYSFRIDFIRATSIDCWLPHLNNIDVVINCVGVFQTRREETMWAIHFAAPKALFAACAMLKIKKIIQISALGIDKVKTPYAGSKLAMEEYLQGLNIPSTIIRPGFVYGKGSYGGSSFFRGLAGLPFIVPLPGHAEQLQQPIHVDDLTVIVEKALFLPGKQMLLAVGAEKLSLKDVLGKLRRWLGFKPAYLFPVPDRIIQLGAKIGNFIPNSPVSDTGIKMISVDNTATPMQEKNLQENLHFRPRGFTEGLKGMVSSVQDRWHARLYFLRPLLRLSIALLWLFSGISSIISASSPFVFNMMMQAKIPFSLQHIVLYFFSIVDILLGLATLFNFRLLLTGFLQCLLILSYTLFISFLLPEYWLHPFAPIAKNIPILIAILIMMALEDGR
jgi:nucleoside-diphosphate-sugar epimerase